MSGNRSPASTGERAAVPATGPVRTVAPPAAGPDGPVAAPAARRAPLLGRVAAGVGEAVAAFGAAALSVQLSRSVVVDPLDRVGQVSGLAGLDLRFVVLGLLVLAACAAAARAGGATWQITRRLACAAVAGLATGLIGGGILLALRGTDWPLFASWGDSGQLVRWADDLLAGRGVPADYPPAVIHLIARLSELTGSSTAGALRAIQVIGTAAFGPIAYLAWRLLLRPVWALAVALVAAVPLLEPYKPYTTVVLVVFVPVLVAFLRALRGAAALTWGRAVAAGAGTGVALGALFLVYSGWFVWSAPGALAAALLLFPWRTAALRGLAVVGTAAAGFALVAAPHLIGLLRAAGTVQDRYFYFDTAVDPAYVAMWRNDLPGNTGPWPPPGELAGVGVFTVLLVVGLGVAVALGARRTVVVTVGLLMAGAWLLRFWFASQMYATGSVQLYPRTTAEILYCLLLLSVLAVHLAGLRARDTVATRLPVRRAPGGAAVRAPGAAVTFGALCAALLLALSMGSSVADRHLPRKDDSVGLLAYVAQMVRQPDGRCPDYSAGRCAPSPGELLARNG